MTILDTREAQQAEPQSAAGDRGREVCEVCCIDDDLTMCGQDAAGMDWGNLKQPITCVVCADLLERRLSTMGRDPMPVAPLGPPCRICPKRRREDGQ